MALRLSPQMTVMQNAAQKASRRLLRDFMEVEQLQVSVKGPSDFVSQADIPRRADRPRGAGQGAAGLRVPHGRRAARAALTTGRIAGWSTRSMAPPTSCTGVPQWCISIALEQRKPDGSTEITAGLVYSPVNDEMFWAERGAGAYLNERRLRVAARRDIKDALFATGIPFAAVSAPRRLAFARTLGTLMPQVAGIRRFGAAALDLAWVAAGRYDGYWELGLKPWDMAAGMLIVREAGGFVTDAAGAEAVMHESAGNDIVAANPHLHAKLLGVVSDGVSAAEGRAA